MSQTQKARIIQIEKTGGPEVMKLVEVDLGPSAGAAASDWLELH
jgi:hypothetical protein